MCDRDYSQIISVKHSDSRRRINGKPPSLPKVRSLLERGRLIIIGLTVIGAMGISWAGRRAIPPVPLSVSKAAVGPLLLLLTALASPLLRDPEWPTVGDHLIKHPPFVRRGLDDFKQFYFLEYFLGPLNFLKMCKFYFLAISQ